MEYLSRISQSMPYANAVTEYLTRKSQSMDFWNIYLDYLSLWLF